MPELPDITAYITALEARILGQKLERVRLKSVFVLRTVDPPVRAAEGCVVKELRRIGKRIAIGVDGEIPPQRQETVAGDPGSPPQRQQSAAGDPGYVWLVIHLMIAGRLHWRPAGAKLAGRQALLALDFADGSLVLTEAGSKRRASLHLFRGEKAFEEIDPGGVEIFSSDLEEFRAALSAEEPNAQARADRSAADQRGGQCVFG